MKDFNHKYERPQLKESSSPANDLLRMFVPKGAQHDRHPANQEVAKLGAVLVAP